MKKTSLLVVLLLMTFTLIAVGSANAVTCNNAILKKASFWGVQLSGLDAPAGNPYAQLFIIEVVSDGATPVLSAGNFSGVNPAGYSVDTGSYNPITAISGSYQITPPNTETDAPECVGTMSLNLTVTNVGTVVENLSFTMNTTLDGAYLTSIDCTPTPQGCFPGEVLSGVMYTTELKKESGFVTGSTCTNALVQTVSTGGVDDYVSFHSSGPITGYGATSGEGQLQLLATAPIPGATGTETGNLQLNLGNAGIYNATIPFAGAGIGSGSFTIEPDCTGGSFIALTNIPAISYTSYTVTVLKGKEALFIILEPGETIVGNTLY